MSTFLRLTPELLLIMFFAAPNIYADGKLMPPRQYTGSLEEKSQEAIIIFQGSTTPGEAVEDLILKISAQGEAKQFAWIIPFPNEPKVEKEDEKLFRELFDYVQGRLRYLQSAAHTKDAVKPAVGGADSKVEVLARKIVGSYDVAIVKENVAGALNEWLEKEGYQTIPNGDDVVGFYRNKGYVFACIKVSNAELENDRAVDLHPLRFTFKTGGRDGIYFPMKLTGLQYAPFDVNLYVFYRAWLNDKLSKYGFEHRGFHLNYRDWDGRDCVPNGGKAYSAPESDPFLKDLTFRIPTVTKLMQKLHPGEKYYLTNIQANGLKPADVRQWSDDLWLFPYYTNRSQVPLDAQPGGPAAGVQVSGNESDAAEDEHTYAWYDGIPWPMIGLGVAVAVAAFGCGWYLRSSRSGK